MLKASLLAASALLALAPAARASTILMETRASSSGPLGSATAYKDLIDGLMATPAGSGYGSALLTSFNGSSNSSILGGSNQNVAYRYTIDFATAVAGTWTFRFGVDFGRGGAVYLDGALLDFKTTDMWWNGSYSNPSQYLGGSANLSVGNHQILLYGLEGCCDGGQQAQFLAPTDTGYTTMSRVDAISVPVSEPAAIGLFGLGLLGLGAVARTRRQPQAAAA